MLREQAAKLRFDGGVGRLWGANAPRRELREDHVQELCLLLLLDLVELEKVRLDVQVGLRLPHFLFSPLLPLQLHEELL